MEVCTSNTPSPQVQPMEVCVCAHSGSALFSYAWLWILSYIRTFFHRVYVDSIYPLSKESSVCVCVCVWIYVSLSLSFSLKWRCVCTLTLALAHPLLSHSLFPFFPLYPSLSLSLCRTTTCLLPYFYLFLSSYFHLRPQNRESTVSRPICEVKHGID